MRKIFYFFVLLSLVKPILKEGNFLQELDQISIDSTLVYQLSSSVKLEVDSIYTFIMSDPALPVAEKEKAILSLGYFMNELGKNITRQRSESSAV